MSVPKLRFPEFRDAEEWEEYPLNKITTSIFDGTHQTPKYRDEGIPFFSVENIVSGKTNKFISEEDYLVATNKNKPEKGDILITRIGNIGFSTVVDWDYEFSIYVTLAVVKHDDRFNSYYLHSFMQSEQYQKEIKSKSLLNAVPCKINMDELRKTKILLPNPKEQKKIADCLTSIDEAITAETQKLDTLKSHKKGLMQQLFPAEGETLPKLRFPEFHDSGEWEVKELSQVCQINPSVNNLPETFVYIDLESVDSGNLLQKKVVLREGAPSRAQRLLKRDDVIFQMVRPYQRNNYYFDADDNISYVASTGYAQLRAYESSLYLFQYLHNDNFVNRVLAKCTGSNYPAINSSDLSKILVEIPNLQEQQKISDCLTSIDDLIASQSQAIELLKLHKKGLMQQLFPAVEEVKG